MSVQPLRLLPDVEALLTAFVKADPDLTALVSGRVYSQLPAVKSWPAIRVTRYGGSPVFREPLELDRAAVQLDVWGASKASAHLVAVTLRAALSQRLPGRQTFGPIAATVCAVAHGQMAYSLDATYDPAIPRYICDVDITYRP